MLREHFLNDLLSGSVPTAEAAVQGERWGLLLTAKQYLVCIVRLPENAVQEQVRALTERLCGEESEVCAFFRGSRRLVLLLRGETEEAVRETAYEFCQNLRHELCQVLGWNALCAIGAPVSRVSALPESYRTAKDTLLQASACADNGVFGSTDFAGVQHEFDFSAGGQAAACRSRGRAAYCRGLFRRLCGAGHAERAVPVLSADESARHSLSAG